MPPGYKTTKKEILKAAISLVREGGLEKITARELGSRLGLSSRPIYSFYPSMDDLKTDVLDEIRKMYRKALLMPKSCDPFLNMGLGQVRFAREEPVFYGIIQEFIVEESLESSGYKILLEELTDKLEKDSPYSDLPRPMLEDMLFKMRLFTYGVAFAAKKGILKDSTDEELEILLQETGEAVIQHTYNKVKGGSIGNENFDNKR